MSHMAHIAADIQRHTSGRLSQAVIGPHHATEAARILLASAPRHARRFALAMHKRISCGLDVDLIEHWARVVVAVGHMLPATAVAANVVQR